MCDCYWVEGLDQSDPLYNVPRAPETNSQFTSLALKIDAWFRWNLLLGPGLVQGQ